MDFRSLYDAHAAFVWRSLRRLGVPDSQLKDAMQDVFVVVHRRLGDFQPQARVTTWLFRICMRMAKDYRRRAHVRREIPDEAHLDSCVDPASDATATLERGEALELFEAALSRIDLEQRTVFMLFELEEMTGEAIAETLELPLGTVYSRLRLARRAFKQAVVRLSASQRAGAASARGLS